MTTTAEISDAPDPVAAGKKHRASDILILILLAATLFGAGLLLGWRNQRPVASFPYRNCRYEDHVLSAVGYFEALGFGSSFFLPYSTPTDYYAPTSHSVYKHIPPFSEVFFGVVHALLGVNTVRGLRWFSIVLNLAALAALFQAMALLKNRAFGLLVVWAVVAQPLFWMRAHGLYEYAFGLPHQALLLLGLALYARTQRKAGLALAFAGAFWQGLCAMVYQLETYFIVLGFMVFATPRERRRYFLVALAGPLAFAAHLLQIALWYGSTIEAGRDLFDSYLQRSMAAGPIAQPTDALFQYHNFGAYLADAAQLAAERAAGGTGPALLALALTFGTLGAAAARKYATQARTALAWLGSLFVGSALWFLAMPEQVAFDPSPALFSLSLGVALSVAVPLYAFGAWCRVVVRRRKFWAAPAALAFGAAVAAVCWMRLPGLAAYARGEIATAKSFVLLDGREPPPLWWVAQSDGLVGPAWETAIGVRDLGPGKLRRAACDARATPACREPIQGLRLQHWHDILPRAATIAMTCAKPGDTRVALYQLGEDDVNGRLLAEAAMPHFTGGRIVLPAAPRAPGRVFRIEIGPAACDSYVIESAMLQ
jgi:hypothetical protein